MDNFNANVNENKLNFLVLGIHPIPCRLLLV